MNDFWVLMLIAVGLAMDCFTVSLCIGASPQAIPFRSLFRVSFHFGLFQGGMTLLGWLLGIRLIHLISGIDHWVAMLLLAWVGGHMVYDGLKQNNPSGNEICTDRTRGSSLVMLSVATSIDALGVGLTLALLRMDVVNASVLIGLVSLVLSVAGLLSGNHLSRRFGKRMEVLGGLVLLLIGLRIVISHMNGWRFL